MIEQDSTQVPKPDPNDPSERWKHYWAAVQPKEWLKVWGYWRTEPEIDAKRQAELAQFRTIVPDIERGIYPFKDINLKLSRADIEWLLATHENERGPVDWSTKSQREREGLDLRGTDLSKLNLANLPLARLRAGLTSQERRPIVGNHVWPSREAAAHLEGTNLFQAHLEGAILTWTHFENASLELAYLELADLEDAHLEGASLRRAHLEGSSLRFVFFDVASNLNYAFISNEDLGCVSVGDTNWGGINLAMVDWFQIEMLGDERRARQITSGGKKKTDATRLTQYRVAVRANRQLAVALQAQGLNEETAKFAYRAQKLQCIVLHRQKKFLRYLFYSFLDMLAGYGYRPLRSVIWYLVIIAVFTSAYYLLGQTGTHLFSLDGALVFSVTSFHGRGFFPGGLSLEDAITKLAALEAVIGLLIEISFIATFTQRFFGR